MADFPLSRRSAVALLTGSSASLLAGTRGLTRAAAPARPILATPRQLAGEQLVLRLLHDPRVKAIQAEARAELLTGWLAQSADARARVDQAIRLFTASLILEENVGDPAYPEFEWGPDNAPRLWCGHNFPGSAIAGDNPDQIYRMAYVDGAERYEIQGQIDPTRRPSQISFSFIKGREAGLPPVQQPGRVFLGNQFATLTDRDLKPGANGRFRILVGGPPPSDRAVNHLVLEPGLFRIMVRDVLSDWRQRPARLGLVRLGPPSTPRRSPAQLHDRILRHLLDYFRYWGTYQSRFLGGLGENASAGPFPREGGWGALAGARFRLGADEAAVISIRMGDAFYTGIQVNDPWMVTPDARRYQTSLNSSQTASDADGGATFVLAARDPGVANWLDTTGLREGYLLVRWIGSANAEGLLREFRIVRTDDLTKPEFAALPRISVPQRAAAMRRRAAEYDLRLL